MSEYLNAEPRASRRPPHTLSGGVAPSAALTHSSGEITGQPADTGQFVHFGWLLGTENIIAVAFDSSAMDTGGTRRVKAYVCDGHGNPDGVAIWFYGSITDGVATLLTSVDGNSTLVLDGSRSEVVTGAFTDVQGTTKRFASIRAVSGAGIYDVTFDNRLHSGGGAATGVVFDARATGDGGVTGSLIAADEETIDFTIRVRAQVTEAELSQQGMPPRFRDHSDARVVPDSYTAVVSATGAFWLGRR